MKKAPADLAVLFADVTGSMSLYEKLGNARALECIGLCLSIMRQSVKTSGGRVIKTIGDELLCVFPTAMACAQAAVDMLSRIDMQAPVAGQPLQIRIGMQFGPVIHEGDYVFGDCVNVAARMVKLAKPMQIMLAGECIQAMEPGLRAQARAIDKLPIKGRAKEVDVYELPWKHSEDMTTMASVPPEELQQKPRVRLRLTHNGREIVFGSRQDVIRFGREVSADVVVSDRKASREHARIERRRDKFVLVDVSSNGTYITFRGEAEMPVRRAEIVLHGQGSISFGHPYAIDPAEVATFKVETLT